MNRRYARKCLRHSLSLGEAPIASHLLYPQVLDDTKPDERQQGIEAGLAWRTAAEASVVYTDRGISNGMRYGMASAVASGIPIIKRSLKKKIRPTVADGADNPLFIG